MKSLFKVTCIIAGIGLILLGAGFLLSKTGLFKGGKEMGRIEKTYESSTAKNLDLSELSETVKIEKGTGDKLVIVYHIPEGDDNVDISETNGTLTYKRKHTNKWFGFFFSFDFGDYSTTVTLPKDFSGELTLSASSGSIKSDPVDCSVFYAEVSSGAIKVNGINSGSTFTAKTTSGSISADDITCSGECLLNSSSGSVALKNISCETLTAKCTSGSVKVIDVTSDNISLSTTSGSIKGTIEGSQSDYSIKAKTVSGHNNLLDATFNSSDGPKSLRAESTSGSINVTFNK